MPNPTRLYLRTKKTEYRRLAWFQNNKSNEMLMGIYGLSGKRANLKLIWPERESTADELSNIRYEYRDATKVDTPIDHITCHADGTFHIKTASASDLYIQRMRRTEPLGPDTSVFLQLILISDLAEHYPVMDKSVKYPHVWVDLPTDSYISFRGMFSGANYALEQHMSATMAQFGGVFGGTRLISGTLKGLLLGRPKSLTKEAKAARPRGTILAFKFPVAKGQWHIKSMLFR